MKMDTLQSFLAQVDAAHAQSCRECDAAFEESVRWLDETVAANKRTLAAQTCARRAPAYRARRAGARTHVRHQLTRSPCRTSAPLVPPCSRSNEIGLAYPAAAKANPPARKRRGLQTVGEVRAATCVETQASRSAHACPHARALPDAHAATRRAGGQRQRGQQGELLGGASERARRRVDRLGVCRARGGHRRARPASAGQAQVGQRRWRRRCTAGRPRAPCRPPLRTRARPRRLAAARVAARLARADVGADALS